MSKKIDPRIRFSHNEYLDLLMALSTAITATQASAGKNKEALFMAANFIEKYKELIRKIELKLGN